MTEFGMGSVGSAKLPSITKKTSNDSIVPQVSHINDRLSYDGSTGAAAPCLPLWGRCPSAHTGADEVGTHRRFVPVPSKRKSCCPALFFPSIVLYAHTGLGAFQPHPTRLTPGHLPQRGRLWCGKRSFTAQKCASMESLQNQRKNRLAGAGAYSLSLFCSVMLCSVLLCCVSGLDPGCIQAVSRLDTGCIQSGSVLETQGNPPVGDHTLQDSCIWANA